MSKKSLRNPLDSTVEPIVNGLCTVVMDAVTGSLNLERDSAELMTHISALVDIAKKVGVDSEKGEGHLLLPIIIKAVRTVTDNLAQLPQAFKSFIKAANNTALLDNLTKSAQELGDSLSHLSNLVNECSQLRMYKILKRAVLYLAEMERLIKSPPDQRAHMPKVTAACEEINAKVIAITTNALNYSKNDNRKVLFNTALDKLEEATPHLIDMAKRIPTNAQDPNFKTRALHFSFAVSSGFQDIMNALSIVEEEPFQKFKDTLAYINILIKGSKELEIGARGYYESVIENAPAEELEEFFLLNQELAEHLISQMKTMKDKELNPTKRAFFEQLMWDLEDKVGELCKVARSIQEKDPNAPLMLENFYNAAVSITQRLFNGPEEEVQPEDPILHTTALTHLSDSVLQPGQIRERDQFILDAQSTASLASQAAEVGKIMDKLISDSTSSGEKAMLNEKKAFLQNQTNSFMSAAKSHTSQPSSLNEQSLTSEHDKLTKIISEIRQLEQERNRSNISIDTLSFESGFTMILDKAEDEIDTSFI